jgi:DNA-binding PadR family transcriptional regulator
MKLLEENGKMYGYEITQKVKAITQELNITEALCIPLCTNLKPKVS